MACKALQNWSHAQTPLTGKNLLLEFLLTFNPPLRQRTAKPVDIAHPPPRQVSGTDKEVVYLLLGQAHIVKDFLPDGFLTGDGQRHVNPVHGHIVDHLFPAGPIPPRHRIAEGAVIEEIATLERGHFANDVFNCRKRLGQRQLAIAQ